MTTPPSMADLEAVHREHWRAGFGSVTAEEMGLFAELIAQHRPRSFIEVGTASGLSGGLTAMLLDAHGGERFVTVDHDNTFFGDTTKENGYLLPLIYPQGRVEVVRRPFTTAPVLAGETERFQMGFVDANHQHPWPLMDTLCLAPVLEGPRLLLHHDLDLYRKQDRVFGIGPKYLWDQFPHTHRRRYHANDGNLFCLDLSLPHEQLEAMAIDAFTLPWSLRTPVQPRQADAFRAVLDAHYSPAVRAAFELALGRFNAPLPEYDVGVSPEISM